jgi:hypothetical protein
MYIFNVIKYQSIFPTFYLKCFGELQCFRFKYCMVIQKKEVVCEGKKVLARILMHLLTAQIEGISKMVLRKSCKPLS